MISQTTACNSYFYYYFFCSKTKEVIRVANN